MSVITIINELVKDFERVVKKTLISDTTTRYRESLKKYNIHFYNQCEDLYERAAQELKQGRVVKSLQYIQVQTFMDALLDIAMLAEVNDNDDELRFFYDAARTLDKACLDLQQDCLETDNYDEKNVLLNRYLMFESIRVATRRTYMNIRRSYNGAPRMSVYEMDEYLDELLTLANKENVQWN